MTNKTSLITATGLACAMTLFPAAAAENGSREIGVGGYLDLVGNLNSPGVEVRSWLDRSHGVGAFASHNRAANESEWGRDSYISAHIGFKAMKSVVNTSNTISYLGLQGAYRRFGELDGWSVMPLWGIEFRPLSMPHIGFIWETGYSYSTLDGDGEDRVFQGLSSQVGVSYYF